MKKQLLSLALALSLCLGLTVPAFAAEDSQTEAENASGPVETAAPDYAPYTMTGVSDNGLRYTVTFDAARAELRYVQLRNRTAIYHDGLWKAVFLLYETKPVTLVTLEPGSGFSISAGGEAADVYTPLVYDGSNQYTAGSDLLGESLDRNLFNVDSVKWDLAHYGGIRIMEGSRTYLVLYAPPLPSTASVFTDVVDASPFKDAVTWAAAKNITKGLSAAAFGAEYTCTHNHILTFLWRAAGSPAAEGDSDFTKAAAWARSRGLLDDAYDGTAPCTNSQAMMYLWKLAGSPKTVVLHTFVDVPARAECAQAVSWAVARGIAKGTSATTFSPDSPCTRGQIVSYLYRNFEN